MTSVKQCARASYGELYWFLLFLQRTSRHAMERTHFVRSCDPSLNSDMATPRFIHIWRHVTQLPRNLFHLVSLPSNVPYRNLRDVTLRPGSPELRPYLAADRLKPKQREGVTEELTANPSPRKATCVIASRNAIRCCNQQCFPSWRRDSHYDKSITGFL
jgi:hypothetical protein